MEKYLLFSLLFGLLSCGTPAVSTLEEGYTYLTGKWFFDHDIQPWKLEFFPSGETQQKFSETMTPLERGKWGLGVRDKYVLEKAKLGTGEDAIVILREVNYSSQPELDGNKPTHFFVCNSPDTIYMISGYGYIENGTLNNLNSKTPIFLDNRNKGIGQVRYVRGNDPFENIGK